MNGYGLIGLNGIMMHENLHEWVNSAKISFVNIYWMTFSYFFHVPKKKDNNLGCYIVFISAFSIFNSLQREIATNIKVKHKIRVQLGETRREPSFVLAIIS